MKNILRLLSLPSLQSLQPLAFLKRDGRDFQILSLMSFLAIGIIVLEWEVNPLHIAAIWTTCLAVQLVGALITMRKQSLAQKLLSLKSGMITALSLSIILRADSVWTVVAASTIAIGAKFVFRVNGKHLFNPANIGIVVAVKFMHSAWISPAQWGNDMTVFFLVATAGLFVLLRVQRLDTSIAFLLAYFVAEYAYNCLYLGWSLDFILHKFTSGSLYLFTFFMITDPKTTPDARPARMVWTALTALLASMLGNVWYMNATPLLALVVMTPFTPLIDKFFPATRFAWDAPVQMNYPFWRKSTAFMSMVIFLFSTNVPTIQAFCGCYAMPTIRDGIAINSFIAQQPTLYNKTSQVLLVRDGRNTVVTMSSDVKGAIQDFAMIVPVPDVPERSDIRVLEQGQMVFDVLRNYSEPVLDFRQDEEPCGAMPAPKPSLVQRQSIADAAMSRSVEIPVLDMGVKVEARYTIGEYDIVILSAEQSGGLIQWLNENGYKIPPHADEVLNPYITSGMKFFVAKVNTEGGAEASGNFTTLRPLQIRYTSSRFMLPIRLGMANAEGAQDLTVYALSRRGQVETVNYRTVKIPTEKNVPLFVRHNFGQFNEAVFDYQYQKKDRQAVFMEYAGKWDTESTDRRINIPILEEAGVSWGEYQPVYITRLHVRYTRDRFPQDLTLQETYNRAPYQLRYTVHHPARNTTCNKINAYIDQLRERRKEEVDTYQSLTGIPASQYATYISEYDRYKK